MVVFECLRFVNTAQLRAFRHLALESNWEERSELHNKYAVNLDLYVVRPYTKCILM